MEPKRGERLCALLGYGALLKEMGQHAEARRVFLKAVRRAKRQGRRRQAAEAHHDLLAIEAERGTIAKAVVHAVQALELYPQQHPYLPALAHELGFLLVRLGHYSTAIPLLELAVPRAARPAVEALEWSTLAWAAAGAGRRQRYEVAEREALRLVGLHDEYGPAVMLHLAEGARSLGQWTRAERYATHAAEAAARRGDATLKAEAEDLFQIIAEHQDAPDDCVPPDAVRIENFTTRLAARLRGWKAQP
jgi:tetratricopeptide (TPR) repeat protein